MQINGNLKFQVLGSGELQNAIIERLATAPTGSAGRIYYDTVENAYFYYNGTSWVQFAAGTTSVASISFGSTGLTPATPTTGAVTVAGTLVAANGGTGQSSYTAGDILYASDTTTLSKLAAGTSTQVLHGGTTPTWGAVVLTTDVSGTLPVANGGTGATTLTGTLIGNGTGAVTATSSSTVGQVLRCTGSNTYAYGAVDLADTDAVTGILPGANGGTGVNNGSNTITLNGGNFAIDGGFAVTLTATGATNVTLPTSGTLVTTTTAVTSVSGTTNQITATGANAVTLSIPNTFVAPGSVEATTTLTVAGNTASSFVYSNATKQLVTTSAPTDGQLLIGDTGGDPVAATLTAGTAISVTNGAGSITIANTGVTSLATNGNTQGLNLAVDAATGSVTLTATLNTLLQNVSALAGTGFIVQTAANTVTNRSIVTGSADRIVVTNGDGVAASPTIDLATVTDSNTGTFEKVTVDAYGRVTGTTAVVAGDITALVDSTYVNVAGDTMTGNLNMGGTNIVTGLAAPTGGTDATNKNYVDALVTGLSWKQAARVATTANVDLSTDLEAGDTVDGVTLVAGDRVLVKNQTDPEDNGVYVAVASGAASRSTDMNTAAEFAGATLFVQEGTVNADSGWTQTAEVTTLGTDPVTFVQFTGAGTYAAGTGLTLTGNTFNVNLGAGIVELPTDEVGIDLYDAANGAIILTTTGSNRVTTTGAQLYLLLDGAGALAQTSSGLKINAASVTNAMLVNSTIPLDADGAGTGSMTLGSTFNFFGTAQRITTTLATDTITIDIDPNYVGQTSITTLGTIGAGTWQGSTVAANYGGTGQSSYTTGDLLYASSGTALSKLAVGSTNQVLVSNGTLPTWGQVSLTAGVTGVLPAANGGTGVANSNTITLGGNISTAGAFTTAGANALTLTTTGATNVTLPTSGTLLTTADTSNYVASFQTSLSGLTPSTATTGAVTLAGTLGVASGGTGATTLTSNGVLIGNGTSAVTAVTGTSGQVLKGTGGAPAFGAVDLTTDVTGVLPSANGGTGVNNSSGAVGTALIATGTGQFTATSIQKTFSSATGDGGSGPATTFVCTHNLGQRFVNVTVYDSSFNQIIPNSVVLTSTSVVTVTVNSAIDVFVVVMGVAGVGFSNPT